MPLNSKKKGNAGEREVVALHNAEGWTAHRNTQFTGANAESPDVSVAEFKFLWIEVKRQQRGVQPRAWLHTAETQAGAGKVACVYWRPNDSQWMVFLSAKNLSRILRHVDLDALNAEFPEVPALPAEKFDVGDYPDAQAQAEREAAETPIEEML